MNLVTSKFNYVCTVLKVEYKITFLCFQGIKTIPFDDIYKHIYIAEICCDLLLNIYKLEQKTLLNLKILTFKKVNDD